jgi:hypothetical protein
MTSLESKTSQTRPGLPLPAPSGRPTAKPATSLLGAVHDAVRGMNQKTLCRVADPDAGVAFQPVTLLALLTYCYAHEIYGSSEVEDLMRRDRNFRKLCGQEFPGPKIIQRFRRENREAIHDCLCAALSNQYSRNVAAGRVTRIHEDHVADEATRRIIMAMFIDNMELNGD